MARYIDALQWIVGNDDTEFLDGPEGHLSVTASLVADLFGRTNEVVLRDLLQQRAVQDRADKRSNT